MFDWVTPQILTLVVSVLLLVGGFIGVHFYFRVLKPKVEASEFWKNYGKTLNFLDNYISDLVLELAFAPGDLTEFQAEAERTGRDVRLVAAIFKVNEWTNSIGLDIDENEIITRIEARIAEYKNVGLLPRNAAVLEADEDDPLNYEQNPDGSWTAETLDAAARELAPEYFPVSGCDCVHCSAARQVLGRENQFQE